MKYLNDFFIFLKHIFENQKLLKTLIVNDFKKSYLGSYLGLFWAFAQPIMYIVVIWFVFTHGLRAGVLNDGTPFFLWLILGMIPWFFLSGTLASVTNSIVANSFLVKKVAFRVSILPLVQIGSALIIHLFLMLLVVIIFLFYGYTPSLYWLQFFYYLFCSIFILLGLGWITSSIRVFIKDISNFIGILVQLGFWATPIFWQIDMIPQKYRYLFKLNPAEYIISGYRDTFIYHKWFWEKPYETLYFLGLSGLLFVLGAIVFRRLRPHFGDVL